MTAEYCEVVTNT